MRRFLERVVRLLERVDESAVSEALSQALARMSAKVAGDSDRFKFNTAIAALMTMLNELEELSIIPRTALVDFVIILAPFAPHLAEHLWEMLEQEGSVHAQVWPSTTVTAATTAEVVVQVNGKRRGSLTLATDAPEAEATVAAHALPAVITALSGHEPSRVIYVHGKIINFVT
jgi:leucyl-tRNA synthetase